MAVDTVLWLLLAGIAGWIYLGCMMTRSDRGRGTLRSGFHPH